MNKASGGAGIPVELFQILKDDAVKVLHSICQQIWKTQQWPQDWKRSVFTPIPKKRNAEECSNYRTTTLFPYTTLFRSGMWSQVGLRKHHYKKASGGDAIPVELFQILKDDSVKELHSVCQQIWKAQQWPQNWKRSVFTPIPKKGNAKECSNYHTTALISHASKVMLKILQARLQ